MTAATAPTPDLTLFQHPEDPRVIITPDRDIFHAVGRNPRYRAAILNEPVSDAVRTGIGALWDKVDVRQDQRRTKMLCAGFARSAGNVDLQMIEAVSGDDLEALRGFLKAMANSHHTMSNEAGEIRIYFNANHTLGPHPHNRPFSNITVGGNGTGWHNENGKALHVDENLLFYFKEDFWHFSAENLGRRKTLICAPLPPPAK